MRPKVYDTRDVYRAVRATLLKGLSVKEQEFIAVIKEVNKRIVEALLDGNQVILPVGAGVLTPRKLDTLYWKDGKIYNIKPIDWIETQKNGTVIRLDIDYIYRIKYTKSRKSFHNNKFMGFKAIDKVCRELIRKADNKEIECFL